MYKRLLEGWIAEIPQNVDKILIIISTPDLCVHPLADVRISIDNQVLYLRIEALRSFFHYKKAAFFSVKERRIFPDLH